MLSMLHIRKCLFTSVGSTRGQGIIRVFAVVLVVVYLADPFGVVLWRSIGILSPAGHRSKVGVGLFLEPGSRHPKPLLPNC